MQRVVADVLLGLAAATVLISCVGVLVMPDAYQKLHFVTPVGVVAPVLVALAVTVSRGYDVETTQTWLAAMLLVMGSPVLGHATARAIRTRECGDWRTGVGDGSAPAGAEEADR